MSAKCWVMSTKGSDNEHDKLDFEWKGSDSECKRLAYEYELKASLYECKNKIYKHIVLGHQYKWDGMMGTKGKL
jgi:hypothetical protein